MTGQQSKLYRFNLTNEGLPRRAKLLTRPPFKKTPSPADTGIFTPVLATTSLARNSPIPSTLLELTTDVRCSISPRHVHPLHHFLRPPSSKT
eukprot:3979-Hanusia_phi.AAC.5